MYYHALDTDIVTLALRLLLGGFFVLARFRWVYDPSRPEQPWFNEARHGHLVWKLCTCGYGKHPRFAGFVALSEISAGLGVAVGLLTPLALVGLLIILANATICTAKTKVLEQQPVDCIDCVSCYLWRVEGLYIVIAAILLLLGPGMYSLDYLVAG